MKLDFQAKFLQYLNKKKQNEGFTLIELLVVIIIIGILAAIALPSFLNQANKAKQSEAKTYAGSMNRGQQAFYLENNEFASQIGDLGLGIKTQTSNYQYLIQDVASSPLATVSNRAKVLLPTAPLKAYAGGVNVATIQQTSEATTLAVLCEAKTAKAVGGPDGTEGAIIRFDSLAGPDCQGDFKEISTGGRRAN